MAKHPKKSGAQLAHGESAKPEVKPAANKSKDTVLIRGVSADGQRMAVLRAREERVEAGIISAVKEGEPVEGEVVRLTPHREFPLLCDVDVEVPAGAINARGTPAAPRLGGPAQVATDRYRDNWDAIWAGRPKGEGLPN